MREKQGHAHKYSITQSVQKWKRFSHFLTKFPRLRRALPRNEIPMVGMQLHIIFCYVSGDLTYPRYVDIKLRCAMKPSALDRRSQCNLNRRSQCIEGKALVRSALCQHKLSGRPMVEPTSLSFLASYISSREARPVIAVTTNIPFLIEHDNSVQ